jgi:hypothetical protein
VNDLVANVACWASFISWLSRWIKDACGRCNDLACPRYRFEIVVADSSKSICLRDRKYAAFQAGISDKNAPVSQGVFFFQPISAEGLSLSMILFGKPLHTFFRIML